MAEQRTWLRRFRPAEGTGARLYCLAHAGGAASAWFALASALAGRVDTVAVQYPGRQDRRHEPLVDDLELLADRVAASMAAELDGCGHRFGILGHSMGAALGFEVTRRLADAGIDPPAVLVVSGRRAPSIERTETVHRLDDDALAALVARIDGDTTAAVTDPEVMRLSLPAIRNDYRAIETYPISHERVGVPVIGLCGADDPTTTVEEVRGWAHHTTASFTHRVLAGGHFFLRGREPEIAELVTGALLSNGAAACPDPEPTHRSEIRG